MSTIGEKPLFSNEDPLDADPEPGSTGSTPSEVEDAGAAAVDDPGSEAGVERPAKPSGIVANIAITANADIEHGGSAGGNDHPEAPEAGTPPEQDPAPDAEGEPGISIREIGIKFD